MGSPFISSFVQNLLRVGISLTTGIATGTILLVVYLLGSALYSLKFHPLARFPGPTLPAISRIPWLKVCITGDQVTWIQQLHAKYGPVVRFAPNDLSYVDQGGNTWKEIYGVEKEKEEFGKWMEFYLVARNGVASILMADYENHRRFRQLFSPAFSDRALKKQEPLFQKYADRLVTTIGKVSAEGNSINMVLMYNLATFDMMGDFTLGQSLGMLESVEYNPWLKTVFKYVKLWSFGQIVRCSPILEALATHLEPKSIAAMRDSHFKYTADRVNKRLETGSDRPDLWNLVLSAEEEGERGLTHDEMHSNAELLMVAGSETSATLMSGLTYFLALAPEKMREFTREIRSSFTSPDEITMESVASLKYMNACIQEALRLYPPVPIGAPRVVPAGGRIIAGRWVAPGTRASVHHYTTYRYPENFKNPDAFVPERWLGSDPAYDNDRRKALQPFSYGPRNCLGQNMAMYEMRIILAKVFFSFDIELSKDHLEWADQKVFALWEKGPLMCYVKAADKKKD